jgi:hypothetical protein
MIPDTVGWLMLYRRAISAPDFRPVMMLSAISRRLAASSFLRRPPRSLSPGDGVAGGGAFADHDAFEPGEGGDHLHHNTSRRGSGVDALGDRPEAGAGLGDPLHDVRHVLERAGQPVEFRAARKAIGASHWQSRNGLRIWPGS